MTDGHKAQGARIEVRDCRGISGPDSDGWLTVKGSRGGPGAGVMTYAPTGAELWAHPDLGLYAFPRAVPSPLLAALDAWCSGIMQARRPNQVIGRGEGPGDPYIDRWFLARKATVPMSSGYPKFTDLPPYLPSELENLYLHRYHRGDADEPHDHPWPNASLVVRGWYVEAIYDDSGRRLGSVRRFPGDIILRKATSVHAILETGEDTLSLFATLPKERDWGFHTADGFVPWREFRPA